MKEYRIEYAADVRRDLQEIQHYIAVELRENTVAKKQIARIKKAISTLRTLPKRYGCVEWEPWSSMGMRRMPVDNYIVYYMVKENVVQITRIFYGGRNVEDIISHRETVS